MESMGHVFKTTRERKRISLSQAAIKTRIKLQHLEMMERDDFSRMPAPAYARGFIRIYADFLGLDAGPLVEEYNVRHAQGRTRAVPREELPPPPAPAEETPPPAVEEERPRAPRRNAPDFAQLWARIAPHFSRQNARRAGVLLTALLLAWGVTSGISRCERAAPERTDYPPALAPRKGVPAVVQEPPDPYLEIPSTGANP